MRYNSNKPADQNIQNRGNDIPLHDGEQPPLNISIMTIDEIIIGYFTDVIKPQVTTDSVITQVPVLYGIPERWSSFREHGIIRDPNSDKIQTPLIMFTRTSIDRNEMTNPSNKYLNISWDTGWNKRNMYDKFAVLNGINPSKKIRSVIIPDYIDVNYEFFVWTETEVQMSELLSQIQVENDEYWGVRNNYKFRIKIDSFEMTSEIEASEDRVIRCQFSLTTNAYLIPEKMVQNAKIVSTNQEFYTTKKIVAFVEVEDSQIKE